MCMIKGTDTHKYMDPLVLLFKQIGFANLIQSFFIINQDKLHQYNYKCNRGYEKNKIYAAKDMLLPAAIITSF